MSKIDQFKGKYEFLSNFYPCVIEYEGIIYPSTEHAYQASKTLNVEFRRLISEMPTPGKAKKAGKIIEVREDWNKIKYKVMYEVCSKKFQIPELRQKLLDTGSSELVEGNWWHDNTWGVCGCEKCPGVGHNFLGRVLMVIRNDIILSNLFNNDH